MLRIGVLSSLAIIAGLAWYVSRQTPRPVRYAPADIEVLVFLAEWCGPCKRMKPELETFSARFPTLAIRRIDVDARSETAETRGVAAVPTVLVLNHGTEILRLSGLHTHTELEAKIGG
ncbi:MAG: thioredoxin family protein, partial [Planctomycetota bacterium]